jgi:hypothetical protein
MTTASGLNAAGLGPNNTGSTIRLESPGDLEVPANILSGGTIVQTFGSAGQLLAENYTWSGRDSSIEIVAGGRVVVGTDTTDINGNPIRKGTFLRASASVSISAGSDANGSGITIYPGGGITANNSSGAILLDSDGAVDLNGYVVSGGQVNLIQNASGETTGYSLTRHDGAASLSITSDRQIKVGQEAYAGRTLTLTAGQATAVPGVDFSDIGILITGSGTLRTGAVGSSTTLSSASGIRTLAAAGPNSPAYAVYAPGTNSSITLQSATGLRTASEIRIDSALLAAGNVTIQANPAGNNVTAFNLSATGKLETQSGNIAVGGANSIVSNGTLVATSGTITLNSIADTTIGPASQINSPAAITMIAGTDLLVNGAIGSQNAPLALTLSAVSGTLSVSQATGRLNSARNVLLDAQTLHFDGFLQTTGATPDADDYEVRLIADELRLTGSLNTVGSLEIRSATTPEIYNVTVDAAGSNSRILLTSEQDLNIGRILQNEQSSPSRLRSVSSSSTMAHHSPPQPATVPSLPQPTAFNSSVCSPLARKSTVMAPSRGPEQTRISHCSPDKLHSAALESAPVACSEREVVLSRHPGTSYSMPPVTGR